jgi:hypothetical protein
MENVNPLYVTVIGLVFSVLGGILGWDEGTIATGKELALSIVMIGFAVVAFLQQVGLIRAKEAKVVEMAAQLKHKELEFAQLQGESKAMAEVAELKVQVAELKATG